MTSRLPFLLLLFLTLSASALRIRHDPLDVLTAKATLVVKATVVKSAIKHRDYDFKFHHHEATIRIDEVLKGKTDQETLTVNWSAHPSPLYKRKAQGIWILNAGAKKDGAATWSTAPNGVVAPGKTGEIKALIQKAATPPPNS